MTAAAAAAPRRRRLAPLGLLGALALWLGIGLTPEPRTAPSPVIGRPAPAFTLPQLGAAEHTVDSASMRGQVWLLNVWASWCAPCREEHPLLVGLAREQGVPLVGLNTRDDPRNAQEWLLRLGDPYRATAVDRDGRISIEWGVDGVPETFVVDRSGVVRHKVSGPLTRETWERELQPLLRRLQQGPV